jgi:predicted PurR-regulated permease PerM
MNDQEPSALITWKRIWLILIVIAIVWLLISARGALAPLFISFILAYLLNPIVGFLEGHKFRRTSAILLLLLGLGLLFLLLWVIIAPIVKLQTVTLVQRFPDYVRVIEGWLESGLARLQVIPSVEFQKFLRESLAALGQLPVQLLQTGGTFLLRTTSGIFSIIIGLAYLALIPILTFYTLRDFDEFVETFFQYIHQNYRDEVERRLGRLNEMMGSFIRGQLTVGLIASVLYVIGFYMADVPFWLLLGILAGLVSVFPYVEWIVGLPITLVFTVIQHQDWLHSLAVLIVFGIISPMMAMVIIPRVIGGRVGIHPVVIIAAILIGGELMGFVGILLAVPLAAAIKVGIETVYDIYIA